MSTSGALPLPEHLRERNTLVEFTDHRDPYGWAYFSLPQRQWSHIYNKKLNTYSADELWSVLTLNQQKRVVMLSILTPPFDVVRCLNIMLYKDGDIEIELTDKQAASLKRKKQRLNPPEVDNESNS